MLARLRDLGFSWFHYAPKADAFLRRRWREPHPSAAFAELADLSAHCRRLGVRFGVGLSPYELYRDFSDSAKADFVAKIRALDEIGLDDVAILFDDTRGDVPDLAARMSHFLHLRGFTGRPSVIGTHVAAHAINPALQPHLSLIPAATLAASYREGNAYCYMSAFRAAVRALAGADLADMLERDLHALQDRGIDRLEGDRDPLRQRYAAVDDPMAAEVVRWLDGADTTDHWVEDA